MGKGGKKKKKKNFKKIILIFCTITLAIVTISGLYVYDGLNKLSSSSNKSTKVVNNEDEDINILALGVDIGEAGVKGNNVPKRTDTMMLINYNTKSKNASVISIPRDTLIKINRKKYKINSAHAIGGVDYAVNAVEKLLDVHIDYYGKVDYEGFREIIDSIGGVDMKITRNMNYDDDTQDLHIHFKKGETVHLNGKKAEEFFRWRINNNGTGLADGDIGRIENQHLFMEKVTQKLKSPMIVTRVPSILSTLPKYCETNMSSDEIIKYGYDLATAPNIEMHTLKGNAKYIGGVSYFIYDSNLNKDILAKLNNQNSSDKINNSNKSVFKIQVLNCTNKNGLAAEYKKCLEDKGYGKIETGNAPPRDESIIYFKPSLKNKAEDIKADLNIKKYKLDNDNNEKFDIIILLGKNFANKSIN